MTARASFRAAALALLAGCYTTTNVATLAPLHTAYPVSASSQYVDQRGMIVTDEQYEIVQPFAFTRAVEAPPHNAKLTTLAFEPDLDRLVDANRGDAVTNLKIAAQNYDAGSHAESASWKILGWSFGLMGATFLVTGVAVGDDPDRDTHFGTQLITTGVVSAGIGALCYVIGAALNRPATWQLEVSGKVVKHTGPAIQAPVAELTHPAR